MSNETKKQINEIRNIEDRYGLMLFRMALSHLVDVGHRNLNDENVAESVREIIAQAKKDKADGKIPVMTAEFQCDIVRCAAELTRFSIWTLFAYIKEHVAVGTESETRTPDAATCSACGSEVEYNGGQVDESDYVYKWTCEECGAYGRDYYDMAFSESIVDGGGE